MSSLALSARLSRTAASLAAATLVLSALAALPLLAEEPDEPEEPSGHCRAFTVGETEAEVCEVTGHQHEVGVGTFEPTIGADPDGNIYYARADRTTGVAIGFGSGMSRSTDKGETWTDVSPRIAGRQIPPETNDPMIYVDPGTGRLFNFHMSPILTCSILSFSDDAGESWTTNPYGCGPTAVWDHQTMVAAKPRVFPTAGYPNVLHQCVNAVYAAMCSRSLDGGLTWSPGAPVHRNEWSGSGTLYGAQHGHLKAAPDGTVYLPSPMGATRATVWVTEDDGLTWRRSVIAPNIPLAGVVSDPAVAIDEEGNVYAVIRDSNGQLHLAVSTDKAQTWSEPVRIAHDVTASMPAIAVGDPGNVVIAYPGTRDLADGFNTPSAAIPANEVSWGGFLTFTHDALDEAPTFTTVNATGDDPLMRGRNSCTRGDRCAYQVDFIDVIVDPEGQVFASLADGCTNACATGASLSNNENHGRGVAVTLPDVRLCAERCAEYGAAGGASAASAPARSIVHVGTGPGQGVQVDPDSPFDGKTIERFLREADLRRKALASGQQAG